MCTLQGRVYISSLHRVYIIYHCLWALRLSLVGYVHHLSADRSYMDHTFTIQHGQNQTDPNVKDCLRADVLSRLVLV